MWKIEPIETYFKSPALSSHAIKELRRSPLHYQSQYLASDEKREPTAAMQLGSLLHMAVLEPERFREAFRVPPKCDKRTKEGKAVYEAFEKTLKPNQILVSEADAKVLHGASQSIARCDLARQLLSNGHAERSGYFTHASGLSGKFRCDYGHDDGYYVDLKFVHDASPREFARSIYTHGYYLQFAWYQLGYAAVTGLPLDQVAGAFIAVEKTPPYAVGIYELEERALAQGRIHIDDAISVYQECQKTNQWPGYRLLQKLDLPRYAYLE